MDPRVAYEAQNASVEQVETFSAIRLALDALQPGELTSIGLLPREGDRSSRVESLGAVNGLPLGR